MNGELEFYTNPMSRGQIVRWMLEETGAPYETRIITYGEEMKGEAYRAINPMGKVPAIVYKGHVVTECAAICAYLADAFPDAGLAPAPSDRADYYRWMFFAAGPLESAVTNKSLGFEPADDQQRMAGYGNFDLVMDVLEQAVSKTPYVTGDQFTAADVYLGAQVGWGLQFGTMPKRAAFEDYWARISSREAYKTGSAKDQALMPQEAV